MFCGQKFLDIYKILSLLNCTRFSNDLCGICNQPFLVYRYCDKFINYLYLMSNESDLKV